MPSSDYADPNAAWQNRNQNRGFADFQSAHNAIDPANAIWGAASNGDNNPLVSFVHSLAGAQHNAGNIMWQPGDESVFNQMDKAQWDELSNKQPQTQRNWIENRKNELKAGVGRPPGTFYDPQTGKEGMSAQDAAAQQQQAADAMAAKKKEADFQQWRTDKMRQLDAFSKQMNMPVEELIRQGDLGVINAGNTGRTEAGNAAYAAGLGGDGISNMNTQRAVTDAQAKYQLDRQNIGLQATNSLLGNMNTMNSQNQDQARYEQGMNLQLQQAQEQARQRQFAEGQQRAGSGLGLLGGVVGGIYGGPQGAAMGYQVGSGLGVQSYGTYQPRALTYPSGNSTAGSGGGGLSGRNPYGGSQ